MNNKAKTKCSFCKYATRSGCMVTPKPYYCKEANDEYYQWLANRNKSYQQEPQKSLRSWDKKR